jgi:uncharacterized protein YbaP (TraB family)
MIDLRSFVRRLTAALTALLALFAALTGAPGPALAKAPAPAQIRPALWKVSDADTTIYLFGTIHALPKGLDWYQGDLARAFESSDTLVTEILDRTPEQMRPIVLAKASLPEGQSLRGLMTPKERAAYEKTLATNALPAAALDRFQPWYAAVALATIPILSSGYDPANGVDAQLGAKAAVAHRTHDALETPEFQLGLFASLPMPVQKRYLREVVKNLPAVKTELASIIRAWEVGNAGKLARLMNSGEDDPAMMQTLLIDRNKTWAQWVKARMEKPGTVFVAVGAGHLAGPGSVQDQLAGLGFKAERVQ